MNRDASKLAETRSNKPLASLMEHIVEKHHAFCRQELSNSVPCSKTSLPGIQRSPGVEADGSVVCRDGECTGIWKSVAPRKGGMKWTG